MKNCWLIFHIYKKNLKYLTKKKCSMIKADKKANVLRD